MTADKTLEKKQPQRCRFKFSGDASEFFGIWFVNHIFSMLTLGLYSPWAKIRSIQYFYANTELGGGSFQFIANPWALFRTRLIAILLLLLYVLSENLSTTMAAIVFTGFIVAYFSLMPMLMIFMLSFRARYSLWHGISFGFNRDYIGAYRVYLAPLFMLALVGASLALPYHSEWVEQNFGIPHYESYADEAVMYQDEEISHDLMEQEASPNTGDFNQNIESENVPEADTFSDDGYASEDIEEEGDSYYNPYLLIPFAILCLVYLILVPYFDFINMRYLVRSFRYGHGQFSFSARAKHFYAIYIQWLVATLALVALWVDSFLLNVAIVNLGIFTLLIITFIYIISTRAYFKSRRTNILLDHVCLAQHHSLQGYIPFISLLWIMVSNSFMIVITFGLMGPWAKVRVTRFMLDRIELCSTESLSGFVEKQSKEVSSLAEEVGDVFEIELV